MPVVSKDVAPVAPHARPWFVLRVPQDARALPALLTMRVEGVKVSVQRYYFGVWSKYFKSGGGWPFLTGIR
jgi:hypothetical protein